MNRCLSVVIFLFSSFFLVYPAIAADPPADKEQSKADGAATPSAETVLFDSTVNGNWQSFALRNGKASSPGAAWHLTKQLLTCAPAETFDAVEDFVVTRATFPVNSVRVDMEVSGDVNPIAGMLGTAIAWVGDPAKRTSTISTADADGLLGCMTWYMPKNGKVSGQLLLPDGTQKVKQQSTQATNSEFSTHSLLVKDGAVSYSVNGSTVASCPLAQSLPDTARRRLALSVCLLDGVSGEMVKFRRVRIIAVKDESPAPSEMPATKQ